MCTAITYETKDHYFGRNLDLEYAYQESVTITPRNFPFRFRNGHSITTHPAIIGMATVSDDYPLYYDATNEFGLSMAGLNFPGNAVYGCPMDNRVNIASFELIPWILSQCSSVSQAIDQLNRIHLTNDSFSDAYPPTPLHWMIADRNGSIIVEPLMDGLHISINPVGVLTNNPPFDYHMHNLSNYMNLTREEPTNRFSKRININPYSRGMGAIGLPGDMSSASRFIKASFVKMNAVSGDDEMSSISQFFHILDSVSQQRGCVKVNGKYEITLYSSCCNVDKGIYYYKTYDNSQITAVHLKQVDLDQDSLISFPLRLQQQIYYET